jgi:hypothetical protein
MKMSTTSQEETKIKTRDLLSLESIRSTLIRQEETIIFALIERSQFRHNPIVYQRGGFGNLGLPLGSTPVDDDTELSFLEYMLVGTVCTLETKMKQCDSMQCRSILLSQSTHHARHTVCILYYQSI